MEKKKHQVISVFSAQITSTISVALVLLLLGIVAFMAVAANSVTQSIRENMGFDVILREDASVEQVNALKQIWTNEDYVSNFKFFSDQDALNKWEEETGEDLIELLGVNPFSPEFEVKLKNEYAHIDSISSLAQKFAAMDFVAEVKVHSQVVESINRNISSIALILFIVAAALILISFVLINNTVRLTVYSRRFIIHTMKLVGATAGFIRRPFIINNVIHGIVASVVAIAILGALLYYLNSLDSSVLQAISFNAIIVVFAAIMVVGVLICALAALLATNKYIRIDYDDMFK